MVIRIKSDRADDRDEVIVQQCIEQLRVDTLDIPDITDVLPLRRFSRHLEKASILAGDTAGLHPDLLHQRNQALVDPVQNHLDNIHRLIVRHAEPCLELGCLPDLPKHFRDILSAAMDDDRPESDQLQKRHILDDVSFQILVDHRASAILDDDRRALKMLDVGERFDQCSGLVQVHGHLFLAERLFCMNLFH